MNRFLFCHLLLAFLALVGLSEGATAATPAAGLGDFVVVAARRDTAVNNAQGAYQEDDPQLVGRLVHIGPNYASFDGDSSVCQALSVKTQRLSAGTLFRAAFPRGPSANYTRFAQPADFRLPIKASTPITASRFQCVKQGRHNDLWRDASTFSLGSGRTALLWPGYSFVLILEPAPSHISPSFNCTKAASTAERTICSDAVLAGWDRSVKRAYDETNGDVDEQRAWLAERDKCGTNKSCLHESMSLRVMNLR